MWHGGGKVGQLVFPYLYRPGSRELRQELDVGVTYYRMSKPVPSDLEIPQVSKVPQTPKAAMPTGHHVFKHTSPERVCHIQT